MDHNTDEKIRHVVDSQMKSFTVIAIAPRISTIANYDKILVLDSGSIAEFDDPTVLLSNPSRALLGWLLLKVFTTPTLFPRAPRSRDSAMERSWLLQRSRNV
ncbi:hypothetical protein B0H17DRAFT_205872 [Mycena rosella]|uniref:Uncharacterized protein n=1 Tax=Mycena rosella TaxID=1033263 RepID=A0AAD7CYK9_MYCRO|nr:hypothetical protein B0H17DRAFT_205872 [Mycena rosella]